jgi:hypothetical protein
MSKYGKLIAAADNISVEAKVLPHMFHLEGYTSKVFVSDELAQRSYDAKLGVMFVDPSIPELHLPFIEWPEVTAGSGFIRRGSTEHETAKRAKAARDD